MLKSAMVGMALALSSFTSGSWAESGTKPADCEYFEFQGIPCDKAGRKECGESCKSVMAKAGKCKVNDQNGIFCSDVRDGGYCEENFETCQLVKNCNLTLSNLGGSVSPCSASTSPECAQFTCGGPTESRRTPASIPQTK